MYATWKPAQSDATKPHLDSGWNNPDAVYPNFDISTNAVTTPPDLLRIRGGAGQLVLVWGTIPVGSDQFSELTFSAQVIGSPQNPGNGSKCGLIIRATGNTGLPSGSGGINAGYFVQRNCDLDQFGSPINPRWELYRDTTLSRDLIATVFGEVVVAGDVLRLQVVGNAITVLHNGQVMMTATESGQSGFPMVAGGSVGFFDQTGPGGQSVDIAYVNLWRGGDIPKVWTLRAADSLGLSESPTRSFSVKSGWAFPPAVTGNPVSKAFIGPPTEDETLS